MSDDTNPISSSLPEPVDIASSTLEHILNGGSARDFAIGTIQDTAEGMFIKSFFGWVSRYTPAGRAADAYRKAEVHFQHYRYSEALEDLTEALGHDHASVHILRKRATVYKYLHQYDDALRDCNKAVVLVPDHVNAYTTRASIHALRGSVADAIADYEQALHYSRPEYRLGIRAELYELRNQFEEAFEAWSAIIDDPMFAWNRTYAH